jgi:hypothetical protein
MLWQTSLNKLSVMFLISIGICTSLLSSQTIISSASHKKNQLLKTLLFGVYSNHFELGIYKVLFEMQAVVSLQLTCAFWSRQRDAFCIGALQIFAIKI